MSKRKLDPMVEHPGQLILMELRKLCGTQHDAAALLGDTLSRCNKMHLCSGWGIEWRWEGDGPTPSGVMRSRMLFLLDGVWVKAKSWDEDVKPSLREA